MTLLVTSQLILPYTQLYVQLLKCYVGFKVSMVVIMKNAVIWDVIPHDFCKNRRFRETYCLHHQGDKNWQAKNNVTTN
jgi:hypothetical protein